MGFDGGGSSSSGYTNMDIDRTSTTDNFSNEQSRKQFNEYYGAAKNNFQNVLDMQPQMLDSIKDINKNISQYQKKNNGDRSYFKQAWKQTQGIDQSNLNKMNSQDLNPYNDEVTRNYVEASNKAADLAKGQYQDQMNQNFIRSGTPNGAQHQTAAAKVGAQYAANINAQNQQTYLTRQNQLEQNALAANNQLGNFYNTLANIGIDYAKLGQQDLSTLLDAYQTQSNMYNTMFNAQNNALSPWGQAVALDSSPKTETHEHKEGTESQSQQNNLSGWDVLGNAGSAIGTFMALCFTGDTLIPTPNGEIEIKDIKVGDEVYARDSKNGETVHAKVTETLEPQERDIIDVYVGDKLVSSTPSQPFLSDKGKFVNVEDMVVGETFLQPHGVVTKLVQRDKKEKVYDIKISNGDCYFANGFIVKAARNEW